MRAWLLPRQALTPVLIRVLVPALTQVPVRVLIRVVSWVARLR